MLVLRIDLGDAGFEVGIPDKHGHDPDPVAINVLFVDAAIVGWMKCSVPNLETALFTGSDYRSSASLNIPMQK
jgi:hypothetical protein